MSAEKVKGVALMETPALISNQLAMVILLSWSQGDIVNADQLVVAYAERPRKEGESRLSAYDIFENWQIALSVAKFTARCCGLPIPKGAHS